MARITVHRGRVPGSELLELRESFSGLFDLVAFGFELEVSVELGDGFVAFLEFLGEMGQDEVGLGIFGLDLDCVLGTLIGGVEVAAVFVEFRYAEVFCDAFVVGLEILDLGEFAAGGSGAGGAIGPGCGRGWGVRVCGAAVA